VGAALLAAGPDADAVLVDCITLLVTNVVLAQGEEKVEAPTAEDEQIVEAVVTAELERLLAARRQIGLPMVVVSNEVGMGLVPPYPLGRLYRDVLGRANQRLAAAADRVYLLVAGLPILLKGK
jgi:adenosylcobinamide kinase/adenosylcobinamide-phosphate guanylyltransferase